MNASEVLREARNVLMERGWHQGWFRSRTGTEVCAVGAVNCVTYGNPLGVDVLLDDVLVVHENAINALNAVVGGIGIGGMGITAWNDQPYRTIHEVFEVFEKAEKHAEIREAGL